MALEDLTQKQIDIIKIIFMIGLILTMIIMSITIYYYGNIILTNPCSLCECPTNFLRIEV
jgi:disulfide bond formation protein DsbB